jgi:hypothetical protein
MSQNCSVKSSLWLRFDCVRPQEVGWVGWGVCRCLSVVVAGSIRTLLHGRQALPSE